MTENDVIPAPVTESGLTNPGAPIDVAKTESVATTAPCVTDLTVQAAHRRWTFDLDVDNVFATRWRDGEFQYASDWDPTDDRVSALPSRHFSAGAPFAARLGIGWRGL